MATYDHHHHYNRKTTTALAKNITTANISHTNQQNHQRYPTWELKAKKERKEINIYA